MPFQTSLGIDIQKSQVHLVFLKDSVKGVKVAAHGLYEMDDPKTPQDRVQRLYELISDFLWEHRTGSPEINFCIPDELAICRTLKFPLAVKENLRSSLQYEMEKYLPVPSDEIAFDYQILSEDRKENRMLLLLVAVKKRDLRPYVDLAAHLKGGISGIETRGIAAANFRRHFQGKKADFVKEEQHLTADFFKVKADGPEPETDGAAIPSPDFIPAYGAALKGIGRARFNINLMPSELRRKRGRIPYYILMVLALLAILSAIAWGGSAFLRQQLLLKELDTEIRRLNVNLTQIDRIQGRYEELASKVRYLQQLEARKGSVLEMLRELSQILPAEAWLTDFSYSSEKGEVEIDGYAGSASELISLIESSPLFRDAVFLSTITKDRDGRERFRIGFKIG